MMQEKKKLDDMAEKYKEEMMRIYNKKRASEQPVQKDKSESEPETKPETKPDSSSQCSETEPEKKCEPASDTGKTEEDKSGQAHNNKRENSRDNEKLMHPPMPEIPYKGGNKLPGDMDSEKNEKPHKPCDVPEESCSQKSSEPDSKPKFPPAEELISMDCMECDDEASKSGSEERAVPAAAMQRQEDSRIPDARFESEGNRPDGMEDTDNNDGHMQGNYNFPTGDNGEADSDDLEPDRLRGQRNSRNSGGQGYFQAEVTEQGSGAPISGAAVVVVRKLGDYDSLEMVLTTDSKGMTESIALSVPNVPANPDNGSDPCGEYMITVYKEGFYSVNMLPVPIFDTIKSIQPVEMLVVGNNC